MGLVLRVDGLDELLRRDLLCHEPGQAGLEDLPRRRERLVELVAEAIQRADLLEAVVRSVYRPIPYRGGWNEIQADQLPAASRTRR